MSAVQHASASQTDTGKGYLRLQGIEKRFGSVSIIRGIDIEADKGEFVVFVGPSGCGKSTLLRMIAGLESVSGGDVFIDGTRVTDTEPAQRQVSMVFQSYALFPHMSVRRQHRVRTQDVESAQGRDREAGRGSGPHPADGTPARPQAPPTFGRAAAARRDRGAPSSGTQNCSSSTNPFRISMPNSAPRCGLRSPGSTGTSALP